MGQLDCPTVAFLDCCGPRGTNSQGRRWYYYNNVNGNSYYRNGNIYEENHNFRKCIQCFRAESKCTSICKQISLWESRRHTKMLGVSHRLRRYSTAGANSRVRRQRILNNWWSRTEGHVVKNKAFPIFPTWPLSPRHGRTERGGVHGHCFEWRWYGCRVICGCVLHGPRVTRSPRGMQCIRWIQTKSQIVYSFVHLERGAIVAARPNRARRERGPWSGAQHGGCADEWKWWRERRRFWGDHPRDG